MIIPSDNEPFDREILDAADLEELLQCEDQLIAGSDGSLEYYARLLQVQLEIEKKRLIRQWGG